MKNQLITTFVTFLIAIIPQIMSNHHQIKLKKLENNINVKRDVLNNFISKTINCVDTDDKNDIAEYFKSMYSLISYFPNVDMNLLNKLSGLVSIKSLKHKDVRFFFDKIIPELSKELPDIK